MRTTRIQSDAKNLLFDCLLHQLGCCCARSLQARSLRSNQDPCQGKFVIFFCTHEQIKLVKENLRREHLVFLTKEMVKKTM